MAYEFLDHVDLNTAQLQNFLVHPLGARPTGIQGRFIFNTSTLTGEVYDGTAWVPTDARKATGIPNSALATDPLARANHTGTQTAATISDFTTAVQAIRWNTLSTPTTAINAGGQLINNVADPVSATDAANRQFVLAQTQAAAAGLDTKESVQYTTTANINLTGLTTQAGGDWPGTLAAGARILVKNQTDPIQNGIYAAASGAWTRTSDAVTGTLTSQAFVRVESSATSLNNTQWTLTNTGTITTGTTALNWTQWGGTTAYTAGNGIDITGNAISAKTFASSGILVTASGIGVDTAIVTRKASGDVGDGTSTSLVFTHNLNTQAVQVSVRRKSDNKVVGVGWLANTVNTVTVTFATAPAANTFNVTVQA